MSRSDKKRPKQSNLPQQSLRRLYSTSLHRACCQWDVLFAELSKVLDKTLRTTQSAIRSPEFSYTLSLIPQIAWSLARGADLVVTRHCAGRLSRRLPYDLNDLSDERVEHLIRELKTEWQGLTLSLIELDHSAFSDRDSPELKLLIDRLGLATSKFLTERCRAGGDLYRSLTHPLASHDGYFSAEASQPLPTVDSDDLNQVVYQLSLLIEPGDSHGEVKPKLVWLIEFDPWFVDESDMAVTKAEDESLKKKAGLNRKNKLHQFRFSSRVNAIDKYLFSSCGWNGKSPLEIWLDRQPLLDERTRQIALHWGESRFYSAFWIRRAYGTMVDVVDLRDEKVYSIMMTTKTDVNPFERDMVITSAIQQWGEEWFWSGAQTIQGHAGDKDFAQLRERARTMPRTVRRDRPSKDLDRLLQQIARQYNAWMKLYGADEVTFETGEKFEVAFKLFMQHLNEVVPVDEHNRTPVQIARDAGLTPSSEPELSLPNHVRRTKNVSIIWNRHFGWIICPELATFKDAFQTDHTPTPEEVKVVRVFLETQGIDPWLFERFRDQHPAQTERLFRAVLRDSTFKLDQFQDVMRKFKGQSVRDHTVGTIQLVGSIDSNDE